MKPAGPFKVTCVYMASGLTTLFWITNLVGRGLKGGGVFPGEDYSPHSQHSLVAYSSLSNFGPL